MSTPEFLDPSVPSKQWKSMSTWTLPNTLIVVVHHHIPPVNAHEEYDDISNPDFGFVQSIVAGVESN